jgi:hypothetical protein
MRYLDFQVIQITKKRGFRRKLNYNTGVLMSDIKKATGGRVNGESGNTIAEGLAKFFNVKTIDLTDEATMVCKGRTENRMMHMRSIRAMQGKKFWSYYQRFGYQPDANDIDLQEVMKQFGMYSNQISKTELEENDLSECVSFSGLTKSQLFSADSVWKLGEFMLKMENRSKNVDSSEDDENQKFCDLQWCVFQKTEYLISQKIKPYPLLNQVWAIRRLIKRVN